MQMNWITQFVWTKYLRDSINETIVLLNPLIDYC